MSTGPHEPIAVLFGMDKTATCPHCKAEIPADASACSHCGRDVSTLALAGKAMTGIGCGVVLIGIAIGFLVILFSILVK